MRKQFLLGVFVVLASVFMVACQKEVSVDTLGGNGNGGGGTNSTLIGAWKFIDMNVVSETTVEESDGALVAKATNLSDYVTRNNTGTISFSDTKMTYTGLGYSIVDTVLTKLYLNGLLVNETETPFNFDVPPMSAENSYTRISSDSLYFPTGGLTPSFNGGASQPGGAKLRFEGNKLYMTTTGENTQTTVDQGVTTTQKVSVKAVITLQRQ